MSAPPPAAVGGPPRSEPAAAGGAEEPQEGPVALWRAGRTAWALVGLAIAAAILALIAGELTLVIVPLILALFPATLLVPVAGWLRKVGLPAALAALLSILLGIAVIGGIIGAMVPLVANQLPELVESAAEGLQELEGFLEDGPLGLDVDGFEGLVETAQQALGEAGDYAGQVAAAAFAAFEAIAGFLLLFVALFFYLKDGRRLAEGIITTFPERSRARARKLAYGSWETLGKYFRGQLLVAFVDAVFIGVGLLILGVPLALPLAVLIFFGGLFPIVGAVVTGALAVLVALADGGLTTGLLVAGLVLLVQQLESNVLEPIILGHAISLHPLLIVLAITAGSLTIGILGAFLAVPVAAIVARIIDELRGRDPDEGVHDDEGDPGEEQEGSGDEADVTAADS